MKLLCILLSIFLLTGCNKEEKVIKLVNTDDIKVKISEIPVYDDVYLYDLLEVTNKDIKLLTENTLIDTETIGSKDISVKYVNNKKEYEYTFTINIFDNIPPLVFSGTNKTVVKGYDGDICNLITYGDNYDGNINCRIEGNYNVNKVGTYKLKYYLSDSSNNIKEVNVTLNVIEKSSSSSSSSSTKKTYFSDVYNKYKTDSNEIGIDVSKWQGKIDFEKVKNAGATFVMMRIGVQKQGKKELEIDPYYMENIKNAKTSGLKVGVYLYSIATSKEDAINHANWVINTLNGESLDLPIVFDWENWSKWNSYKISFHEINKIANVYMSTVKNKGYEGMLYSSKFYLETIWENNLNFPVWLAHYTEKTSYKGSYIMWQLCNNGRIDGINGDVDIDILYK